MKTGTKRSKVDKLLVAAAFLCVFFVGVRAVEFIYGHIPPYKVGQCLTFGRQEWTLKIVKNEILEGYSLVETRYNDLPDFGGTDRVPFVLLRDQQLTTTECLSETR